MAEMLGDVLLVIRFAAAQLTGQMPLFRAWPQVAVRQLVTVFVIFIKLESEGF
jgi:hypothetical protein